jgi:hypothetical protein
MDSYDELFDEEHDEIMRDVRERQAETWEIMERFEDDPEGFRRWEEADLARFGYRLEPVDDKGGARLVRIDAAVNAAP